MRWCVFFPLTHNTHDLSPIIIIVVIIIIVIIIIIIIIITTTTTTNMPQAIITNIQPLVSHSLGQGRINGDAVACGS